MLKSYFKIAIRNLVNKKAYSIINIFGLALGIACCLIIVLYIKDELSFDHYNTNYDRTYRVVHAFRSGNKTADAPQPAPEEYQVWGNAPIAGALTNEFPGIDKIVRFTSNNSFLLENGDKRFQEQHLVFMDSTAFDVFTWPLLYGDPEQALVAPFSIVLSESTARKYFGDQNPVGKTLKAENSFYFTVSGVMKDIPRNSHIHFNGLISMSTFIKWRPQIFGSWGYVDFYTYFTLKPGARIADMSARIPHLLKTYYPDYNTNDYRVKFEPLSDAYLKSLAGRQPGVTGNYSNIIIFGLVGLFILCIACVNFINLATARSMERAKEVGVRKSVGAHQSKLIYQFLTESTLITFLSVLLAIVICLLVFPILNNITGKSFSYISIIDSQIITGLLVTPILIGLLAGVYPALVLSRFDPVIVLKGKFNTSARGSLLRKSLVVLQFSLSVALVASTVVVYLQLMHMKNHELGFMKEQMLVINYAGDEGENFLNRKLEMIKQELGKNDQVIGLAASRTVPGGFFPNAASNFENPAGEMQSIAPALYEIDFDFIPVYQIKMAAGRAYSRKFMADTTNSMIINEAAAKLLGYNNPGDIIGKKFSQWGRSGTVIGVVKDFNYKSLHNKVEPLALRFADPDSYGNISLRIKTGNIPNTIRELQHTWERLIPGRPFQYFFLDQSFNEQYQNDIRFGEIFSIFAILAIIIACLGLFGLATYATHQRIKEIGVRKVLGASVTSIITLLSSEFVMLVLIAILLATPLSWWAMNMWLDGFAYHVTIHWWIFMFAGMLAIFIALATVSFQTLKVAFMNPVKSLRSE